MYKLPKKANEVYSKIKNVRFSKGNIHAFTESLQYNSKNLIITVLAALLVMFFVCAAVFFATVKGEEEVLVPEVKGKPLTSALIEMQKKELYPKITLRYSETPGDEGTILDQSPHAGSIVKGYSRVSLVVSRGVVVEQIGDYIGTNIEDLKMQLQTLFAGHSKPLIVLAEPMYKPDTSDAGTILEQNPAEGTAISEPVTLQLVVSRGPTYENTKVPNLQGYSVNDILQTIARSRIIFTFNAVQPQNSKEYGTVVSQQTFDSEFIPNYSRMTIDIAIPSFEVEGNKYGIFSAELTDYPYPVPMHLDATDTEGNTYTLVSFLHTGGNLTLPYAVPSETVLTLYVVERMAKKIKVH